jgi:thiol-disulfide isomerase/thioredoxin
MLTALTLVLTLAISPQVPQPTSTTPGGCLKEVRDYAAKRTAELPPVPPFTDPPDPAATAARAQRTQLSQKISADRLAMAKACAAKFNASTVPQSSLADLALLYTDAAMPAEAKKTIDDGLKVKSLSEADRAALLVLKIQSVLREPIGAERNSYLESLVGNLDGLSNAVLEQAFSAHNSLNGYYRYDDIDAGIIKHSTWMIDAMKKFSPEQRKKFGPSVVGAYVNMAQAWGGQGMNDKAIALLNRAKTDLADVPSAASRIQPELERLQLVGTTGAPITAPRWLNMPAGKTTLDLKGKVTLLEFSAHWCVPCKESYPGVNRMRAKYGPQGFQVVLVTELYGYFQQERPLDAEAEFARDKTYFAEHGLDVPIAVGDHVTVKSVNGKIEYLPAPDPNDTAYKVGGIPQIHLIDKQGRIRLVMVGYDDANEAKIAKMIEDLLKEK